MGESEPQWERSALRGWWRQHSRKLLEERCATFRNTANNCSELKQTLEFLSKYCLQVKTTKCILYLKHVQIIKRVLIKILFAVLIVRYIAKFTQSLIQRANIPNAHLFLGHSFRKGGATSLHEAGYPDSLIKIMGRWSSFAFATYIDTPLRMIIEAGRSLLTKVDTNRSSFWDVSNLQ